MSNRNQCYRNDERKDEYPPYSRVFIVCSKDISEQDLRDSFEKYGEIENVYIPKDRNSGAARGVAYIKYTKTSSAAAAIENLHLKTIAKCNKPLKVMIASKKDDMNDNSSNTTYNRIFVKIGKQATEDEIKQYFSKFGHVESVLILKEKSTNENKGLAFVQFQSFLEAATAFENCDKKYKAVFAAPKQELKRGREMGRDDRHSFNDNLMPFNNHMTQRGDCFSANDCMPQHRNIPPLMNNITSLMKAPVQNYKTVVVTCTPILAQKHLERLFDIIPGMQHFQYNEDVFNGYSRALVTYEDERAASHAVDRLNKYEFPSGELLTVKPDNPLSKAADDLTTILSSFKNAVDNGSPELLQLADAIAQASTLIKAATTGGINSKPNDGMKQDICSVPLPPIKPLANPKSTMVKRCFIVCKPRPPPQHVLQELFCRFGDLIAVAVFPNKTFAFAEYASEKAADDAMKTLHGATIYGMIKLKVLEADEKRPQNNDKMEIEDDDQNDIHDAERKRMRLGNED